VGQFDPRRNTDADDLARFYEATRYWATGPRLPPTDPQ